MKQLPREKVQLATKFGIVKRDAAAGYIINCTPEYVRASVEASLKRLDVEYIDLYYQHRVDTTTPIEVTVSAAVASIIKLFLLYTIQSHRFSLFHTLIVGI